MATKQKCLTSFQQAIRSYASRQKHRNAGIIGVSRFLGGLRIEMIRVFLDNVAARSRKS